MQSATESIGDWEVFLDKVFENLKAVGVGVDGFELDHIAYRATTRENYERLTKEINFGKRISTKIIRGREVDMYLLDKPLIYGKYKIKYFEVLAPAEGDKFEEGLEHCEFMVKDSLHEMVDRFPKINWNSEAIDREVDAEVGIKFGDGLSAKFKSKLI